MNPVRAGLGSHPDQCLTKASLTNYLGGTDGGSAERRPTKIVGSAIRQARLCRAGNAKSAKGSRCFSIRARLFLRSTILPGLRSCADAVLRRAIGRRRHAYCLRGVEHCSLPEWRRSPPDGRRSISEEIAARTCNQIPPRNRATAFLGRNETDRGR